MNELNASLKLTSLNVKDAKCCKNYVEKSVRGQQRKKIK